MKIIIREFTNDDAEEVAAMHRRTILEVNSKDYPAEQIELWASRQTAKRHMNPPENMEIKLVAVWEGKILGFAAYTNDGELSVLYVGADYQGMGVGKALVVAIEEDAKNKGYKGLKISSTLTAFPFYKKRGYQFVSEAFHEIDGHQIKIIEMQKDFSVD